MKHFQKLKTAALTAAVLAVPVIATGGEPQSCTVPGVTVMVDPAGDEQGAPATSFGDIQSLSIAEPAGADVIVFTFKMADLSTLPPNGLWPIRFNTDVPPPNGDDMYFVAMVADPTGTAHFIYGTEILEEGEAPRLWTPQGNLEPSSNFNADGTITLVLDKSKVPGLVVGGDLIVGAAQMSIDHSPTDGSVPFTTGLAAALIDSGAGFDDYIVAGNSACTGKSGVLGLGAMPAAGMLFLLALAGLRRRAA